MWSVSPPKVIKCPGPRLLGTSSPCSPIRGVCTLLRTPTSTYWTTGRIAWPAPRSALLSCSPVSRVGRGLLRVSQLLGDSRGGGAGTEPPGLCARVHTCVCLCVFVFLMLSFKPAFSLSSFNFIKKLFSSSLLSAIRVISSAYLRLLIFLLAIHHSSSQILFFSS